MVSKEIFDRYFSCFSDHSVEYKGIHYTTAEHAYHCQRYSDQDILSEIQNVPTARDAWSVSQKYKDTQHADFAEKKRDIMKAILIAKLEQHSDVRDALSATGEDEISKHEPKDAYWGMGPDGKGRNELGKLWMEIRDEMLLFFT